jgi:hypothetical protein
MGPGERNLRTAPRWNLKEARETTRRQTWNGGGGAFALVLDRDTTRRGFRETVSPRLAPRLWADR